MFYIFYIEQVCYNLCLYLIFFGYPRHILKFTSLRSAWLSGSLLVSVERSPIMKKWDSILEPRASEKDDLSTPATWPRDSISCLQCAGIALSKNMRWDLVAKKTCLTNNTGRRKQLSYVRSFTEKRNIRSSTVTVLLKMLHCVFSLLCTTQH